MPSTIGAIIGPKAGDVVAYIPPPTLLAPIPKKVK